MNALVAAGDRSSAGSMLSWRRRSAMAGSRSNSLIVRLSRSTMSRDVPAGATTTFQVEDSSPGKPASARVGTSGAIALRLAAQTARARNWPLLTYSADGPNDPNMKARRPATRSCIAGPVPR